MRLHPKHLSPALAVIASFAAVFHAPLAAGEGWRTYTNARFGFRLEYPATLQPGREPDNGAGMTFSNGEFSVTAQGHFLHGQTLADFYREALARYGQAVTYKVMRQNWFVVSGTLPGGTEFYKRFAVQGGNWAEFTATYPAAKSAQYDPVIERMSKSFQPFLPGNHYDRIP